MRVAVIGAGAAGLVCARELIRAGLSPVVLEASRRVGGTWVYSDLVEDDLSGRAPHQRVHGSMYASLRTNLPRDIMAFRDYPFDSRGGGDDDWPRFVGHAQVAIYLNRFAEHFGITPRIQFERSVTKVERFDGGWRVHTAGPTGEDALEVDAVAVCNGHYHLPFIPGMPGSDRFDAAIEHSHNYRRPDRFAAKRVVVLGAKASGMDLSGELAEVAEAVYLCAREPSSIPARPRIQVVPGIASLGPGRSITLEGGQRIDDVDVLLLCTGYCYHFPFFADPNPWFTREPHFVHPLWLEVVAIRAPTLGFIGLPLQVVPFPQVEIQSRLFAQVLTGRLPVTPEGMLGDHRAHLEGLRERGVAPRHLMRHGPRQFAYYDDLAHRVGSPPLPDWFQPLYEACREARRRDPTGYRDQPLPAGDL